MSQTGSGMGNKKRNKTNVAIQKAPLIYQVQLSSIDKGHRDYHFWPPRQIHLATQTNLFGHPDKFIWPPRQIYLATQTNLFGHPDKFIWSPKQIYLAIQTNLLGHLDKLRKSGSLDAPGHSQQLASIILQLRTRMCYR